MKIIFITMTYFFAISTSLAQTRVIKQKTSKDFGWPTALVTYSYYLDEDGEEVVHGKVTSVINDTKKHGGTWTGAEKVTYQIIDGKLNGFITASFNKKYWYSKDKWVNGGFREVFSLIEDITMLPTKFRVVNGILDGKININTGIFQINGEAKDGYWIGRLIIKGKNFKGIWKVLFNEFCDPYKNVLAQEDFESMLYNPGGLFASFHNINGIYPYEIKMPIALYTNEKLSKEYRKQLNENVDQNE